MKHKVVVTGRDLLHSGKWDAYCEMTGTSVWAINEGRMDGDEEITLTYEQACELGIVIDPSDRDYRCDRD